VAAQTARVVAQQNIRPHLAANAYITSGPVAPFMVMTRRLLAPASILDTAFEHHELAG